MKKKTDFKIKHVSFSKESQIGCGYCTYEKTCPDYDPKINKAKDGCPRFLHFLDDTK